MWRLLVSGLILLFTTSTHAELKKLDYALEAVEITQNTYLFQGRTEDFSRKNGGNILNTAFIVTDEGVVVIDSGPSRRFAEQQRAAIAKVTDKPVIRVYITHHHPDHFLGNQVYTDVPVYALPASIQGIHRDGEMFTDNMYRMVGDWMRGTQVTLPSEKLTPGTEEIGGHTLQFIAMQGHTAADLVIFDQTTGVLFTGDIVFNQRAATTPHAVIKDWLAALQQLQTLPFKVLVPGHGPVSQDTAPITQTRDYLEWLATTLQEGAESGMDMAEVMQTPIPARFQTVSLAREELQRSVAHLFPALEEAVLQPVTVNE